MSRIGIVVLKQFILRAAEACSQGGLVCEEILGVRRRADKQGLLLVYCNSTSQPGYRFGKFPVRNFSSTPSSSWEEVEEIQSGVTSGDSAERSSEQQIELLWKNFFSDPAQWWDRRSDKVRLLQITVLVCERYWHVVRVHVKRMLSLCRVMPTNLTFDTRIRWKDYGFRIAGLRRGWQQSFSVCRNIWSWRRK